MSGIFRTHSLNSTSHSTPQKRYSFGAFCTSPSTLKDVTMEHSYGVGFPCVSLQGQGSTSPPVQGRSVREFEEQMASLRKENFNLKLRLYFLEESVPGYHQASTDGHESLMKQLIETKVETEILRKEVEQKQELLKEAAQAMNHMEEIQKETEIKGQAYIEELKQKIQFLEMERDLDKTQQSGFMNDLLGHSEISENVNTLQKIRELEGMVTQSDDQIKSMQQENNKFEELIAKRDETIKEYEEKVKELAFQNAELLEMMENKEKDMANIELNMKRLRLCNANLNEDNCDLIDVLKSREDNFRKEYSNMKLCEKRMREQQEALSKMQSTISLKTANTARLLERIQDYEKMVTKMNFERNLAKRENRFFRAIIGKLQRSKNECFTIEKEEFYQQYAHEYDEKPVDCNKQYEMNYRDMLKGRGDFHGEYLLKQKLLVNYSNNAKYSSKVLEKCEHDLPESKAIVKCCYLNDGCARHRGLGLSSGDCGYGGVVGLSCDELEDSAGAEPAFPIRYTISDASMFTGCDAGGLGSGACTSRSGSCTSLQADFSAASLYCGDAEPSAVADRECVQRELTQKKFDLANTLCELDDAQQELQKLRKSYDTACRTLQQFLQQFKIRDSANRALSDSEALKNQAQTCDHESTIKKLEAEVKKKTADLQNLVNNELWQKNREIERLTKLLNENTTSPLSPTAGRKNLESLQLQQSFTESDYAKALEHNKLLQGEVDVLNQRLIDGRSNEVLIDELRQEVRRARSDANNAEAYRLAYARVFAAVSDRLYELASFLNSLMKHKEVLSFLSTDRRRAMRTAVDCSLDLSTSIRETLNAAVDHGMDLSNISRLLLDDDDDDEVELTKKTFNSPEQLRVRHSIDVLRSENKALPKALDSRRSCGGPADYAKDAKDAKDRRSLPPFLLDNLSESEAWSEPDREVSMARIGLEEHATGAANVSAKEAISKQTAPPADTDSESESDALQLSRTTKQRYQERITQLEKLIEKRDKRILMIQLQLVETDINFKNESFRTKTLTTEVELLRKHNMELRDDLIAFGKEKFSGSSATAKGPYRSVMQRKLERQALDIVKLQQERDSISSEARVAKMQVAALEGDMEELKQKYETQLRLASEREHRVDTVKRELEELMHQRLKEQERIHRDTLTREWIARDTYEECKAQLTALHTHYMEAESTINNLRLNELDLKEALLNSGIEVRNLKKQLDDSVLQASKFVGERTKLCNEKLQVEKRLMEVQQRLSTVEIQRTTTMQRVTELETLQQTLTAQLMQTQAALAAKRLNASYVSQSGYASDEAQKSSTIRENNSSPDLGIHSDTGRVSSVELSNVQHSRLKTVPMPSGGEKVPKEEINYSQQDKSNMSKRAQHSSSTDVVIESDARRMSSMDIKNESPARTETDDSNTENNMSVANVNTSANAAAVTLGAGNQIIHDCFKVEQENAELRRKLVHTKRAFEETYKKLHIANQRKETFQKEIKDQITKTKNVLKYARLHMSKVQQPNAPQQQQEQETQQKQNQKQQHHHQQQQRNVTNDSGASTSKSSSNAPH